MSAIGGNNDAFSAGGANGFTAPADSARITKELLQEIRRGDAAMADDLVALAPRSGRAFRAAGASAGAKMQDGFATNSTAAAVAARASSPSATVGAGGFSISVNDKLTASDFVKQKREVGLVRMSLATKKAEIRKLDEKVDRAEKRLRQQQEQLTNTQEKFNSFLKFSNLEQDAAVRKADDETRAKHAKTIEIKRLSALINHAELETRKTRLQVDNCASYKEFLEGLVKSQWFYDVLISLRSEDKREEILLSAETTYQMRCEELRKASEERDAVRRAAKELEERERRRRSSMKKPSRTVSIASTQLLRSLSIGTKLSICTVAPDEEGAGELSLEQEMANLHDSMEDQARSAIAAAETAIRTEVSAMPLSAVKEALHREYDENRLPMCFETVDDLLEVFINVEEGNLFLIQNCQELEEELEGISLGFAEEKAEMSAMVSQRTAQLVVLEKNIAEAREKLKALDARITSVEPRSSRNGDGAATRSFSGAHDASGRTASFTGGASGGTAAAQNERVDLTPEELKVRIEVSIGHMFQLLTTGDQVIKAGATKKDAANAETFHGTNHGSPLTASGVAKGTGKNADGASGALFKGSVRRSESPAGGGVGAAPSASRRRTTSKKKGKASVGARAQQPHQHQQQHQDDASMGPVEMLTIVENKLEEYHRYLLDPSNHIDASLIQAVMKQSDKQRRRQARLVHLANQEQAQEERIRRALERSQAPIAHRTGKPVRPRSHVEKPVDEKMLRKAERAAAALEGSGTSFDSDEDGAEFFK
ncbi:hypothetical protein ABB37_01255 [Leptomonas pyrrhocoris]|uniref:DUF4200 domain-containing protein n=1 Tax=Leptomonas pyrrhocoris TaxID=157538 RepID=A0A0N0DZ08_LEPPY|nr:hypothetical protein ABB37_01255 [Leptomonas pyrrhocoris]KPA84768.1 hypothetical protein ABB37_01255 [Leptomonas pyrrhocoris]|eukprot:XP_015663207.1 hypothetical protein ABB37_01255 [Leptomonas pyrrhocoris]